MDLIKVGDTVRICVSDGSAYCRSMYHKVATVAKMYPHDTLQRSVVILNFPNDSWDYGFWINEVELWDDDLDNMEWVD